MRFYQKGMSFREFQKIMGERRSRNRCRCDCDGCKTPGTHCLVGPCGLTRNRRTEAEVAAERRSRAARVKVPDKPKKPAKNVVPKQKSTREKTRSVWFVDCVRNEIKLSLPAPRGEDEAFAMCDNLIGHGWMATVQQRLVWRDDPRFNRLPKEVAADANRQA